MPYARGTWTAINNYGIPLASTFAMRRFARNIATGRIPKNYGYFKRYGRGPTVPRNFGWWASRRSPPLAVRNAHKLNQIMRGKEVKNWDQTLYNDVVELDGSTAVLLPTRLIAEGTGENERTGTRIKVLSLQLKIKFLMSSTITEDILRVIIVNHRVCESAGAGGVGFSVVYSPASIFAFRERNQYTHPMTNTKSFYDRTFTVNDAAGNEIYLNLYFTRKQMGLGEGDLTTYGEGDAAGTNLGSNHMQIYLCGKQGTTARGSAIVTSRLRFTDS